MATWQDTQGFPGWQTMWQLTPVGMQSADNNVKGMTDGMWEMARLAHSRSEGMLNRKAQKDAQKRQEKAQKKAQHRAFGQSLGVAGGTALLTAGIGAAVAPEVTGGVMAAESSGAASSLEPVAEGAAMKSVAESAPITSAASELAPVTGTADMASGLPVMESTSMNGTIGPVSASTPFEAQPLNGATPSNGLFPKGYDTPTSPGPSPASSAGLQPVSGQASAGASQGDYWNRFGKMFGLQMLGQAPMWGMYGGGR